MGTKDPRVGAYIAKSADFARPILTHLRGVVHNACPRVEETLKWGFPHFMYEGILCSMAGFKAHCAFGFWKGGLIVGAGVQEAMGQFGRIETLDDLPSAAKLRSYVKQAMRLNERGVSSPRRSRRSPKPPVVVPTDLDQALARNAAARKVFEQFSPSHRREYVEWINEAKGDSTRKRRLSTTIEWLVEGKPRNWKYLNC